MAHKYSPRKFGDESSDSDFISKSWKYDLEDFNRDKQLSIGEDNSTGIEVSMSTSSNFSSEDELFHLFDLIQTQKRIVINCLEEDHYSVEVFNEQIGKLQDLVSQYSELEFSVLVESEVNRRLSLEKKIRSQSLQRDKAESLKNIQSRISLKLPKHHHEVDQLRRTLTDSQTGLFCTPINLKENDLKHIVVTIPSYQVGSGGKKSFVEYKLHVECRDSSWIIFRRFRRFHDLHTTLCETYGTLVASIAFPKKRLLGNNSVEVAQERQTRLQAYLNSLMMTCGLHIQSPLFNNPTKKALLQLSPFFKEDP